MSKAEETTRGIMGGAILKAVEDRQNVVCWLCWSAVPIDDAGKFSPHIIVRVSPAGMVTGVCGGSGVTLPATREALYDERFEREHELLTKILVAVERLRNGTATPPPSSPPFDPDIAPVKPVDDEIPF